MGVWVCACVWVSECKCVHACMHTYTTGNCVDSRPLSLWPHVGNMCIGPCNKIPGCLVLMFPETLLPFNTCKPFAPASLVHHLCCTDSQCKELYVWSRIWLHSRECWPAKYEGGGKGVFTLSYLPSLYFKYIITSETCLPILTSPVQYVHPPYACACAYTWYSSSCWMRCPLNGGRWRTVRDRRDWSLLTISRGPLQLISLHHPAVTHLWVGRVQ